MRGYDDLYYGMDNSLPSERSVRKTGRSSTRKKSTEPETENGIISNAVCVKVREMPDPEANVLGHVNSREKVKILDEKDGYYKIEFGEEGIIGFISSDFCRKE